MRHDYSSVKNIYIICGKTDMRKGIDGLATLIQDSFELVPYVDSHFLFSGRSNDRYKCLHLLRHASSNNQNQNEKLIRLLEDQLAYSNQQNEALSKQIESLTEQVRY